MPCTGEKPTEEPENCITDCLSSGLSLETESGIRTAFDADPDLGITLLFQRYYGLLCSYAFRTVRSEERAERIVSDVFYEFDRQRRFLTITTSFRTCLFMEVQNRLPDRSVKPGYD